MIGSAANAASSHGAAKLNEPRLNTLATNAQLHTASSTSCPSTVRQAQNSW
jgi:hypothetical protein